MCIRDSRKGVDDVAEHEPGNPAHEEELQRMGTLDPKEHQVAGTHERRLRKGEQREERVASQIELVQVNRLSLIHILPLRTQP